MNFENIFDVVANGSLKDVRNFVEQKRADVNEKDGYYSVLETAIVRGDENIKRVEIVKYLISKGAELKPFLIIAVSFLKNESDSIEILKLFLKGGINVNY